MWNLAYSLDFGRGKENVITADNSEELTEKFNFVIYEFILESEAHGRQHITTQFKAFSEDIKDLCLGERNIDVEVKDLYVHTHRGFISDIKEGHFVFTQHDYTPFTSKKPDILTTGAYGCMQMWSGDELLWSINHFNDYTPDFGIGNNTNGPFRDWTFANNGDEYTTKQLNVYVL